ncbi:50S ribosomal protein L30 [Candidatus Bathyarchaeota archaeon]|nr:50S ribosomal protein L30 [Candidatus Bathyarchaeota archaeon]
MTEKVEKSKCLVVVKIRGTIRAKREARETLDLLNMKKTHNAVVIDNRPSFIGMLYRVQNYVTWGEITEETMAKMIKKRGRLAGNKRFTDVYAKELGYESITGLANVIFNCKVEYRKIPNIQTNFRLHPPKKGFKGKTKKSFAAGGESGNRREKINDLILRMI